MSNVWYFLLLFMCFRCLVLLKGVKFIDIFLIDLDNLVCIGFFFLLLFGLYLMFMVIFIFFSLVYLLFIEFDFDIYDVYFCKELFNCFVIDLVFKCLGLEYLLLFELLFVLLLEIFGNFLNFRIFGLKVF